ncbi:hypothetical protein SAMN04487819_101477 [Actinopolyspora alba]|uniref:SH3 domain-containing protein n=1 Tax=Actinopolyspora alba TaxID=673379 RepID=A0A1I1TZ29_9ACTN|nr:hypothetical protein [Actinopolyspora alba]SFD63886.1 hypothetical protein SAMN04487819_101477 [Actinopolyspora alba]
MRKIAMLFAMLTASVAFFPAMAAAQPAESALVAKPSTTGYCTHYTLIRENPGHNARPNGSCKTNEPFTAFCFQDMGTDLWIKMQTSTSPVGYVNADDVKIDDWQKIGQC